MSGKATGAAIGAVAAVLALSACGSAATDRQPSGQYAGRFVSVADAAHYARTHPVPRLGNMSPGVIALWTDTSTGQFYAWEAHVVLASGLVVIVYCGDPVSAAKECTWRGPGQPGDYMYFPGNDDAARPGDVRMIKAGAVR